MRKNIESMGQREGKERQAPKEETRSCALFECASRHPIGPTHPPSGGPMQVSIRIPAVIRDRTGGRSTVHTDPGALRDVLAGLRAEYPALIEFVTTSDDISPFVNIYVDGEDVRALDGLDTSCPVGAKVAIIPAVAGG